jgi:glycosyltransferase involved in cell wall biosynthesis
MILTILISTINAGIKKVSNVLLPGRDDVKYIVIQQYTDNVYRMIPVELIRDDVNVFQIYGKGLTRSRNYGIFQASGDIALIADDDVTYTNEYFDLIIETFQRECPDIALFKIKTIQDEGEYKDYPPFTYQLSLDNFHSLSSIEIAFNINKIRNNIKFDERFGLGTFLIGGEEMFFVTDAIKKGLKVKYYPFYVVNHHQESTIRKYPEFHIQRVKVAGATYARKYGWLAIPRIFIRILILLPELLKSCRSPIVFLYQMYLGCFYILFNKNKR